VTFIRSVKPADAGTSNRLRNVRSGKTHISATSSQPEAQAKRGGHASRAKGNRCERAIVRALQDAGFAAERVPLSGSAGGSYCGDLTVPLLGVDRIVEVKVRARGFAQLYDWLERRDLLVVRADRREPLVILPFKLAIAIAAAAERDKGGDR